LDRKLGGPQNRSGHGGEEKNFQPLTGIELPIIQPVAQRYTTEIRHTKIVTRQNTSAEYIGLKLRKLEGYG
jgi:hypothetical protein